MNRYLFGRTQAALIALALAVMAADGVSAEVPHGAKGDLYNLTISTGKTLDQKPLSSFEPHARDYVEFWRSQEGKLFDRVTARLLLDQEATAECILAALDRAYDEITGDSTVVINLLGHGGFVRTFGEWGFCAYDRMLPGSQLREKVQRLASKAKRVIIIIESCHSGAFEIDGPNVVVITATNKLLPSWQINPRFEPSYGRFTRAVLRGLEGAADADGDGTVTLDELEVYVMGVVEMEVSEKPYTPQKPSFRRAKVPGTLPISQVKPKNKEVPPGHPARRAA